jgi:hypothetical protein
MLERRAFPKPMGGTGVSDKFRTVCPLRRARRAPYRPPEHSAQAAYAHPGDRAHTAVQVAIRHAVQVVDQVLLAVGVVVAEDVPGPLGPGPRISARGRPGVWSPSRTMASG